MVTAAGPPDWQPGDLDASRDYMIRLQLANGVERMYLGRIQVGFLRYCDATETHPDKHQLGFYIIGTRMTGKQGRRGPRGVEFFLASQITAAEFSWYDPPA